MFYFVKKTLI